MIDDQVKIHDNYSLELKMGFITSQTQKVNNFKMNLWMFIPNSLDINRFTYDKSSFYRDLKSNIRQITPIWKLDKIIDRGKSPYNLLKESLFQYQQQQSEGNLRNFEFRIKMFQSILKSALREEVKSTVTLVGNSKLSAIRKLLSKIEEILINYRNIGEFINNGKQLQPLSEFYRFGDEFMSNITEFYLFKILENIKEKKQEDFLAIKEAVFRFLENENNYRQQSAYMIANKTADNHELINRMNLLKKYIESHLFLNVHKRRDGILVEQLSFSLAAGLSMVFATAVAFSFQQHYGSFTMPLFVALVISYMLKDRIKEMTRYYFAHKMGTRFFDHKASMQLNEKEIGGAKESIDFVSEKKIPLNILQARAYNSLLEAHNRANSEKVLLYRFMMSLNPTDLNTNSDYSTNGVNAIIRFNFSEFMRNMDDSQYDLYSPDQTNGFVRFEGEKLYFINLVLEKKSENQIQIIRYRVAINRDGIKTVLKMD